jgi:hypothetical protein
MSKLTTFQQFVINEAKSGETFEQFAQNRLNGATKIANDAHKKGGDSLLTYQHFKVKLPYYKKAASGKFKLEEAQSVLSELLSKLDGSSKAVELEQMDFQRTVGKIEVLGELIIQHSKITKIKN